MRWKSRYWVYVMLFAMATINYLDRVALSVSAQDIVDELGIDKVELGYLFSSFLWGYTLFLIPAGLLVDRYGSRRVAVLSMAVWSAATALTGAASSVAAIMAARIVMGAGESSCFPAGLRIIRDWSPNGERATATTSFNSGAYFGPAIGALSLSWMVAAIGWRWTFVACGAVGVVWVVLWLAFFRKPEETSWLPADELDQIQRERETREQAQGADGPAIGLGRLIRTRTMWGLMLTQGAGAYTQYLFLTWLPNYLQTERGMTLLKSGTVMAVPYLGAILVSVGLGMLSDRLLTEQAVEAGRRRILVGAVMLGGAVILAVPWVESVWLIVALITIALGSVATAHGLNIALLGDLLQSKADVGRAMAMQLIGGNVLGFLAPIVTGYVVQSTGRFDAAFAVAGVLLVMGALSSWCLARRPMRAEPQPVRAAGLGMPRVEG